METSEHRFPPVSLRVGGGGEEEERAKFAGSSSGPGYATLTCSCEEVVGPRPLELSAQVGGAACDRRWSQLDAMSSSGHSQWTELAVTNFNQHRTHNQTLPRDGRRASSTPHINDDTTKLTYPLERKSRASEVNYVTV